MPTERALHISLMGLAKELRTLRDNARSSYIDAREEFKHKTADSFALIAAEAESTAKQIQAAAALVKKNDGHDLEGITWRDVGRLVQRRLTERLEGIDK